MSTAAAAPGRPRVDELPNAYLPSDGDNTRAPDTIAKDESDADLPFEVVTTEAFAAWQKRLKQKRRNGHSSYSNYQHLLTVQGLDSSTCLNLQGASAQRTAGRDQALVYGYQEMDLAGVRRLRTERLVDGNNPELVVEDFFVDLDTAHAKRVSATRVPLAQVTREKGLTIYAFRDRGRLNLVLSAPGAAMVGPTTNFTSLGCGMRRVLLPNDATSGVAMSFALGLPDLENPERLDDFQAHGQVPMARSVRVSVSLSRLSRDPRPVLSITVGRPSKAISDALQARLPTWVDALGQQRASELETKARERGEMALR